MTALHFFSCNLGLPFPTTVTDPTPSEHKRTLQERRSNSQHEMDRTVTMQTGEVATEKEHVYAGNLRVVRFVVIL